MTALPRISRLDVRNVYVAFFHDVAETYDAMVLKSLKPLLGDDLSEVCSIKDKAGVPTIRRFCKSMDEKNGLSPPSRGLTPFAAAQVPGFKWSSKTEKFFWYT